MNFHDNLTAKNLITEDPLQVTENPLYVEFVGLPGAGKTTVLRELIPRLVGLGCRCVVGRRTRLIVDDSNTPRKAAVSRSSVRKVVSHVSLHVRLWQLALVAYRYVFTLGRIEKKRIRMVRELLRTVGGIRSACEAVRSGRGDLVLFGQGVAAHLRQIAVSNGLMIDEKLSVIVKRLREAIMPIRVVLVVLDVDADTAVARIEERPKEFGSFDRMGMTERWLQLSSQLPRIEQVLESLKAAQVAHHILRIDATKPPAESAAMIADFLVNSQSCRGWLIRDKERGRAGGNPTRT